MTARRALGRRRTGVVAQLAALRRRLLRGAWMLHFELLLDDPAAPLRPAPAGLVVRRATPSDDDLVERLALGREPMRERRARGDVALVAEIDGRAVGCTFVARAPVRLDGYLLSHAPRRDEAHHYGLHVVREARRRGVAEALSQAVAAEARARGARVLTCWVDAANRAGVALQESLGLRVRSRMLLLVVANRVPVVPWRRDPAAASDA